MPVISDCCLPVVSGLIRQWRPRGFSATSFAGRPIRSHPAVQRPEKYESTHQAQRISQVLLGWKRYWECLDKTGNQAVVLSLFAEQCSRVPTHFFGVVGCCICLAQTTKSIVVLRAVVFISTITGPQFSGRTFSCRSSLIYKLFPVSRSIPDVHARRCGRDRSLLIRGGIYIATCRLSCSSVCHHCLCAKMH